MHWRMHCAVLILFLSYFICKMVLCNRLLAKFSVVKLKGDFQCKLFDISYVLD